MKLRSLASEFVVWQDGSASWKFPRKYGASEVWRHIRQKQENVPWHKLVWSSINVPKHAFVSWMAILNRLPTRDRLKECGIEIKGKCELCHDGIETRNHIFFGCQFSKRV